MREHHALRAPGGSSGVEQRGEVVLRPIDDRQAVRLFERVQRHRALGFAVTDHGAYGVDPGRRVADLLDDVYGGDHRTGL